ncbi:MAG: hypothetical protein KDD44_07730 [Bdellovibrionales bacterium]|nr:hypothetical protein [Bdellovibrionales bacterium]
MDVRRLVSLGMGGAVGFLALTLGVPNDPSGGGKSLPAPSATAAGDTTAPILPQLITQRSEEPALLRPAMDSPTEPGLVRRTTISIDRSALAQPRFQFAPFPDVHLEIDISPNTYRSAQLSLPNLHRYAGTILDANGRPIGEASLSIIDDEGTWLSGRFALEDGRIFVLGHSPSGNITVSEYRSDKLPTCGVSP